MSFQVFKQCQDWDCANQAVAFVAAMMGKLNKMPYVKYVEDEEFVKAEPSEGASHGEVWKALHKLGLEPLELIDRIKLPCIVNYLVANKEGEIDGHYAVIFSELGDEYMLYDPSDGCIKTIGKTDFERIWKSFRYPPDRWSVNFTVRERDIRAQANSGISGRLS